MFDHEKLDAYQRAIEFLDLVDRILEATPKGRAHLKDQLDRAATSVVLNIAEGSGTTSTGTGTFTGGPTPDRTCAARY